MLHLLCLGDSITDSGRLFLNPPLGMGYVYQLSHMLYSDGYNVHNTNRNMEDFTVSHMSGDDDYDFHITNRGVDGFTVSRLLDNCESQYLPLHGDIITILIGINDIGLMMNTNRTPEQKEKMMKTFFANYEQLLATLGNASASPQLILMEPFIFAYPAEYQNWFPYVRQMSEGIAALADKFDLPYILLQDELNAEAARYGIDTITTDGIHLTTDGHKILAEKLYRILTQYI